MKDPAVKPPKTNNGHWVVIILLTLCVLGTGITWINYSGDQMLSTRRAEVIQARLVVAEFPASAKWKIKTGMFAKITAGSFFKPVEFRGRVSTIIFSGDSDGVAVEITTDETQAGPPLGARCRVSIDTSLPQAIP